MLLGDGADEGVLPDQSEAVAEKLRLELRDVSDSAVVTPEVDADAPCHPDPRSMKVAGGKCGGRFPPAKPRVSLGESALGASFSRYRQTSNAVRLGIYLWLCQPEWRCGRSSTIIA